MSAHFILEGFAGLGILGLTTSGIYGLLVVSGVRRFLEPICGSCSCERRSALTTAPVSIMKPLHDDEPGLEANLVSFFEQEYADFEILFCARRMDDRGLQVARRVAARYPHVAVRFLQSGKPAYANAKVASLAVMARAAAHDIFVISDSDVRVGPSYLRDVAAPFADARVGAVTCLYRGMSLAGMTGRPGSRGLSSFWSLLEGVGMSVEMTAGVLVADLVEGMRFVLGPTMAVRRHCVEQIGGFDSLGQYCSDDYLIGNRIAKAGHEVVLSRHVIDHVVLNTGFVDSMKHQARWMKSTRFSRPKGHLGTALTFAMPYAVVACLALAALHQPMLALLALLTGLANRMVLAALLARGVVKEREWLRAMLLYPIRDFMGFVFWAASYAGNRIVWRGRIFELHEDGLMRAVAAAADGHTSEPERRATVLSA